ncbi:MAG TPA: methionine--tRNA ligase [Steroidobacteraceae bacterium]|jgi:methionyl-tRNA synthetase|nr:methionine--tRNA ligase [Steroidobacteraceae bacterium]
MPRKILVTHALPYANGPLHVGHLVESVQTDVWVRFQRMRGHDCIFCCAEDTHGTPIMIRAQQEGITPQALIARSAAEHQRDYAGFLIGFDQFHSTDSAEARRFTLELYEKVREAGYIERRSVRQAYDEKAGMFLPDRFVRGTCPNCKTPDQYGDACEVCGSTYTPAELIDPVSTLSQTKPVWRDSEHLFFRLSAFDAMLREYIPRSSPDTAVRSKLNEWLEAGLQDWDISRDSPYFGIEIPDAPGKFFYVWFDAPIGYIGSFEAWRARHNASFDDYWKSEDATELYHFIGKDISYFHNLFWPAVLKGAGLRRPTAVFVHGFLTINGQKMSKSRGTFVTARRYLERLPPEPLRYYFAAKLGSGIEDMDFSLTDFVARTNSDLVGKLVNIASRCAGFIQRGGGRLSEQLQDAALYQEFVAAGERIAHLYESREYATAMRDIMELADRANQYVDRHKPWALAKDPTRADDVRSIATQGINLFRVLMSYLAPVLPKIAQSAAAFLGTDFRLWNDIEKPLLGSAIAEYQLLAMRLDPALVAELIDAATAPATTPTTATAPATTTASASAAASAKAATKPKPKPAAAESIRIDDFARIDLRVARVLEASTVDGSDKLLQLKLDLGQQTRTVFSGIRGAYEPDKLIGRLVVVVANLEPRKMRFGVSQGMVLCASGADDAGGLFLLDLDSGAQPGMRIT